MICFHNSMIIYEAKNQEPRPAINYQKEDLTIEDFIRCNHFNNINPLVGPAHTSSAVFRNGLIKKFPDWFYYSASGDLPFYMLIAESGKGKYLNDIMSTYRKHGGGVTSFKENTGIPLFANRIEMYESINKHFKFRYNDIIRPIIAIFYLKIAMIYAQENNKALVLKTVRQSVTKDPSLFLEAPVCDTNFQCSCSGNDAWNISN